jgi:hypothetical protein
MQTSWTTAPIVMHLSDRIKASTCATIPGFSARDGLPLQGSSFRVVSPLWVHLFHLTTLVIWWYTFLIHSGHLVVDTPGRLPLQMQEPYNSASLYFLNRHCHFASDPLLALFIWRRKIWLFGKLRKWALLYRMIFWYCDFLMVIINFMTSQQTYLQA